MSRDSALAAGLLAFAGLYWMGADRIRVSRLEGVVGAQAVPKGLAASLAILAVLLLVQDLWRGRRTPAPAGEGGSGPDAVAAHGRALGMLLIGAGYLLVVGVIGYVPAIALLVLATAVYMGRPPAAPLVLLAAGGALLYYLVFVRLLGIPLPAGVWPDLWRGLTG